MNARKRMLISVSTLLGFSFFVLMVTFYSAGLQKPDAQSIQLVGRQRMLSQKISNDYLLLTMASGSGEGDGIRSELANNIQVFENTQNALLDGGEAPLTLNPGGAKQQLPGAQGQAFVILAEANVIAERFFDPINNNLKDYAGQGLNQALGKRLLTTLDAANDALREQAESKLAFLVRAQRLALAISFVALVFLISGLFKLLKFLRSIKSVAQGLMAESRTPRNTLSANEIFSKITRIASSKAFLLKITTLFIMAAFFSLIAAALISLWHTYDASVLNLASRQSMLIQKISKEAILLQTALSESHRQKISDDLSRSLKLIKLSHEALMGGGYAPATFKPTGRQVMVPKPSGRISAMLAELDGPLDSFLASVEANTKLILTQPLNPATAGSSNKRLLFHQNSDKLICLMPGTINLDRSLVSRIQSSMSEITEALQSQAERKIVYENAAQLIGFALSFISFLLTALVARKKYFKPLDEAIAEIDPVADRSETTCDIDEGRRRAKAIARLRLNIKELLS